MSRTPLLSYTLDGLRRRLADMERAIGDLQRRGDWHFDRPENDEPEAVFSQDGAVTASTSGPFKIRSARTLSAVAVSLGTAGSTDTIIEVRRNGVAVTGGTITLAASATTSTTLLSVGLAANDIMTVAVTTAGTAAEKLTVQLWF